MSGSTRAITLSLDVRGAELVQAALRQIGPAGEEALRRLDAAAARSAAGTRQATQAVTQFTTANDNAARGMSRFGPALGNAGFQIQDFAVQVQGGTSALTAFAQQAPQFLGAFGTAGAIAGAAVAVGAIAYNLLSTAANVKEVTKEAEAWKRGQEAVNDLLETAVQRTARIRANLAGNAEMALRGALSEGAGTAEIEGTRVLRLERERASLLRMGPGFDAELRDNEVALASARDSAESATRRMQEARRQLDQLRTNPGALGDSRQELDDARRVAAVPQVQRPVIEATIRAEREARELNLEGLAREEFIRNKVEAATLRQEAAITKAGQAEAARLATAQRAGEAETIRSRENLALLQSLAAAETPREAMLAKQTAETERATVAIRARVATETDPTIRRALEEQIDLITRLRREAVGLEETARNRLALFSQQQRLEMQGLERRSMGMSPTDRARFLAEETERQRIEASGGSTSTEQALERIRRAGEIAVGDEALRRVKEYTGAVQEIGGAFADAFTRGIFEGKKLGDVFKDLDKQIAQIIFRTLVMKPLENAIAGAAGSIGNAIGGYFGSGGGGGAPAATPTYGGLYANGGIMSQFGDVPLRKYASGGIANSPQMAIFGEGSMAEAYVPLPDGRRIPVEQRGGGGTTVMIDARGAEIGVEARIEAGIRRAIPGIVSITKGSLASDMNRGGSMAQTFGRRAA